MHAGPGGQGWGQVARVPGSGIAVADRREIEADGVGDAPHSRGTEHGRHVSPGGADVDGSQAVLQPGQSGAKNGVLT